MMDDLFSDASLIKKGNSIEKYFLLIMKSILKTKKQEKKSNKILPFAFS
jgi:hypothetical protein